MSDTETELTPDTNSDAIATETVESQPDAASASSSSPEVDSAPAPVAETQANPEGAGNDSLKTGVETQANQDSAQSVFKQQQQKQQQQQAPEDWKKRHDGQFQANLRLSQELKQLKQQFEQAQQQSQQFAGYDPQKWQQFVQTQRSAGMPIWHPEHAEHSRFQDLLRTADYHERIVARAGTPEEREWALRNYAHDVGPEDRKLLQQFKQSGTQELQKLQMNPVGYLHQQVLPLLQQELQKWQSNTVQSYQQAQQGRGQVEQWIKENQQLATQENLQKAYDLIGKGWSFEAAAAKVERDIYHARLSQAELKERSAEEKHRLLQANASVDRDPAANTKINLFEETKKVAKQRGITNPTDPRLLKITDELRKKHNIKG